MTTTENHQDWGRGCAYPIWQWFYHCSSLVQLQYHTDPLTPAGVYTRPSTLLSWFISCTRQHCTAQALGAGCSIIDSCHTSILDAEIQNLEISGILQTACQWKRHFLIQKKHNCNMGSCLKHVTKMILTTLHSHEAQHSQ